MLFGSDIIFHEIPVGEHAYGELCVGENMKILRKFLETIVAFCKLLCEIPWLVRKPLSSAEGNRTHIPALCVRGG